MYSVKFIEYKKYSLRLYLSVALLANLFCLFVLPHGGDQGFWKGWTIQLMQGGYAQISADYPPMYLHWLYLVGKLSLLFKLVVETNDLYKFFWLLPAIFAHLLVLMLLHKTLIKNNAKSAHYRFVMLLAALNPALFLDGPMWGQVDILGPSLVVLAICAHFSGRYAFFAAPLYALALLTKFQMICFAPIFGFLFFHKIKAYLLGMVLAVVAAGLAFAPFLWVGHFKTAFMSAYVNTVGQYPYISMNAANIWVLLVGNNAPDSVPYWQSLKVFLPQTWLTAKYVGMFVFSVLSLVVFLLGIYRLVLSKKQDNPSYFIRHTYFLMMLNALGFFALLPGMHERYLFPAVVVSAFYVAFASTQRYYFVLITLACSLNILMLLSISGSNLWLGTSWLVIGLLTVSAIEAVLPNGVARVVVAGIKRFYVLPFSFSVFCILALSIMTAYLYNRHTPIEIHLKPNQLDATTLPLISSSQSYGQLRLGRSVENNPLTIDNRVYATGFGTHAESEIKLQLPPNAIEFSVVPGIDDEVSSAKVQFEVWEDDRLAWQSPVYLGHESGKRIDVALNKGTLLTLKVRLLAEKSYDHADWASPVVTVEEN